MNEVIEIISQSYTVSHANAKLKKAGYTFSQRHTYLRQYEDLINTKA